jgi:hypothetical protein
MLRGIILAAVAAIVMPPSQAQPYASNLPIDHPAIRYYQQPLDDPVSRLSKELESGKVHLEFREGPLGYLPSLLEHLGINPDSQALVFSKTSFQATKISPRNPRAIYFSDDAAVGWVRGGTGMEVAALDPRQGIIFYTLDAENTDHPRFNRREVCLHCHQGPATEGVPGIFVGSVFPDLSGMPARLGAIITDHRTPFRDRWGGWYVNAVRGEERDRANAVAPDPAEPQMVDNRGKQNLTNLALEFSPAGYLSPVSDIVALMTFEHQTRMVNLITRLGWQARMGADCSAEIEELVSYMLFKDEAPLREPVQGVSTFTTTFPRRGPRDRQGRSLRDFDLQTRLFRYPLSYMIYSAAFDALPDAVRERVYRRLADALTSNGQTAILEIVRDTKSNLPAWWR